MNRTIRTTATALGMGVLLAGGLAVGTAVASSADGTPRAAVGLGQRMGTGTPARTTAPATTTSATASTELADALAFTREEEKMARDLYAAVADLYDGARPFSMITTSEQQHYDAVGALLDRYGIADPAGTENGVFQDAAIQDLYDAWWARAQTSIDEAYRVGVELEQRDIADLQDLLAAAHPSDVDAVLASLLRGSERHLAAFDRAASGDLTTGRMGAGMGTARGTGGPGRGMHRTGNAGDCPMPGDES